MNREIFRAWDKEEKRYRDDGQLQIDSDGEWTYYIQGHCQCGSGCADEWLCENRIVIEWSTGLKDKKGVDLEWYAGDIIQKGEIILAITVDWEHGMRFMLGKHILCKQDGINGTKIGNIHTEADNE